MTQLGRGGWLALSAGALIVVLLATGVAFAFRSGALAEPAALAARGGTPTPRTAASGHYPLLQC